MLCAGAWLVLALVRGLTVTRHMPRQALNPGYAAAQAFFSALAAFLFALSRFALLEGEQPT